MQNRKMFIRSLLITALFFIAVTGCKKDETTTEEIVKTPSVSTGLVGNISQNSASCTGSVDNNGGAAVNERGIYWSVSQNPGPSDNKVSGGAGTGTFSCNLTGLTSGTTYYFRAFAVNSAGTGLGTVKSFKTTDPVATTVNDIDGNIYHIKTIGTQEWLIENLKTTHFCNGDDIPLVSDPAQWNNLTGPAFCYYDNNPSNGEIYGNMYNLKTVDDTRKICPAGWHVPSDEEWILLSAFLGGEDVAGGKLKETGFNHWKSPNTGATNESGFTALPGGSRDYLGNFIELTTNGHWWSSTHDNATSAWSRRMGHTYPNIGNSSSYGMNAYSVRCIKD